MLAALIGALAAPSADAAPRKKDRSGDRSWVHPELARFAVDRIAVVPAASYDGSLPAERVLEAAVAQSLHASGYRWISPSSTRDLLRSGRDPDSTLRAVKKGILDRPRVDSLAAPGLCARLRCDALLAMRIDQWEQRLLEPGQSGKPSTSVQLKAALVDSSGTLLWSVASSETAEGAYQDGTANPTGISAGRLVSTQGGAPDFLEVVAGVTRRWAALFPAKAAPDSATAR